MPTGHAVGPTKTRVRDFWEQRPCGSIHGEGTEGSPGWYEAIERRRNQLEPFIERFADFSGSRAKDVLEIGVGLGSDLVRFARAGARVTGIDLTSRSVELVRRRLALEGLEGDIRVGDAEALPYPPDSFDIVYSWGVLHHTPATERAVREAVRVVRPGGRLIIMLYARYSWVGWGLWARHGLLRGRPWRSLGEVIAHHMESTGTKAFTTAEVRAMLAGTEELKIERVLTPYDHRVAGPLARITGNRLGWFIVARARAPRR